MKLWTRIIPAYITAIALSIFVRRYFGSTFPPPVAEGLAFWTMFVALHPVNALIAERGHKGETPFRRPSFMKSMLAATLGATVVTLARLAFGW